MVAVLATGCDLPPCESLDLRATQTRASSSSEFAALLAVGDRDNIEVLRECDTQQDCTSRKLSLNLGSDSIAQLMLTGSGRRLIYFDGTQVADLDMQACTDSGSCGEANIGLDILDIKELVGTLRGGDWIIYRTEGERLRASYFGDEEIPNGKTDFSLDSLTMGRDLLVGALGYRHVVARKPRGDGTEELYLIRVVPARKVDELGSTMIGEPQLLATGPAFRRVLITAGPSPAERGDPKEFQHDVPTDAQVIVTSGEGSEARTLIFDVSNLSQIANFAGEIVTKHAVLEDVPGLSAVSPDGTHLAYLTSDGGLALRNLETQRSCLVKSSNSATHLLAGFAADATLYFEAAEDAYVDDDKTGYALQSVENIHTYDPLAETFTSITTPDTDPRVNVWRLRAVPPKHDGVPWAVAGYNGDYIVKPGAKAEALDYVEAQFLPRSNEAGDLWVIEAGTESQLDVHRLRPDLHEELGGGLDSQAKLFSRVTESNVCVSSSPSAGWTAPWATRCSPADEPEEYLDNGLPDPEQGP